MEGTYRASTRCVLIIIRLYRSLISPFLVKSCRFYPTCSQYAFEAVNTHGAVKGLLLSFKRLLKCHPLHPGGYDPVPPPVAAHKTKETKRKKKRKNGVESIFSNNTINIGLGGFSNLLCKASGHIPWASKQWKCHCRWVQKPVNQ